jgi:hypothetical protein
MGLDAVVYLRPTTVVHLEGGQPHADCETAELPLEEVPAIHKRLGNASMIGSIADEVLPFIGIDSLLLSKVLYSGSHSGDSIGVQDLDRLDSEINRTREKISGSLSSALETFLEDMSDLVRKAREQKNPIVFI